MLILAMKSLVHYRRVKSGGALLVVDAAQGVEAQTLANVYLAIENSFEIIPVLNKIDLPSADPDGVKAQIEEAVGLDASEAILASAKDGVGIEEILEAIVKKNSPPLADVSLPLRGLVLIVGLIPIKG